MDPKSPIWYCRLLNPSLPTIIRIVRHSLLGSIWVQMEPLHRRRRQLPPLAVQRTLNRLFPRHWVFYSRVHGDICMRYAIISGIFDLVAYLVGGKFTIHRQIYYFVLFFDYCIYTCVSTYNTIYKWWFWVLWSLHNRAYGVCSDLIPIFPRGLDVR